MIKGLIFQFDGVIADVSRFRFLAFARICEEKGCRLDANDYELVKSMPAERALRLLMDIGNVSCSERELNELCKRKDQYFKEALEKISTNSLTLGIREFIRQAKEEGYVTALLFDQDCARTITESLHIASLFDRILPSRDEPQTDAFVKAADALDLQKQECVAFVSSSAAAAMVRAADLRCVAVGQSEASFYSDYHIRDFRNQNAGILIRKAEGE
jgi:beta-phosphoglucomutase